MHVQSCLCVKIQSFPQDIAKDLVLYPKEVEINIC